MGQASVRKAAGRSYYNCFYSYVKLKNKTITFRDLKKKTTFNPGLVLTHE